MDWAPVDWLLVKYHAEWKWVYQTASFHQASAPANYAGKQQTTYLFGKENIHQATVEDEVKPIWRHCKVTFLSEVGEFSAEGWRDYGGTYWIPVLKSQTCLKTIVVQFRKQACLPVESKLIFVMARSHWSKNRMATCLWLCCCIFTTGCLQVE